MRNSYSFNETFACKNKSKKQCAKTAKTSLTSPAMSCFFESWLFESWREHLLCPGHNVPVFTALTQASFRFLTNKEDETCGLSKTGLYTLELCVQLMLQLNLWIHISPCIFNILQQCVNCMIAWLLVESWSRAKRPKLKVSIVIQVLGISYTRLSLFSRLNVLIRRNCYGNIVQILTFFSLFIRAKF